jgi:hypothetical protein
MWQHGYPPFVLSIPVPSVVEDAFHPQNDRLLKTAPCYRMLVDPIPFQANVQTILPVSIFNAARRSKGAHWYLEPVGVLVLKGCEQYIGAPLFCFVSPASASRVRGFNFVSSISTHSAFYVPHIYAVFPSFNHLECM